MRLHSSWVLTTVVVEDLGTTTWHFSVTLGPCFDLRCDEFWDQPAGAGDKRVARRVEAAPGGLVAGRTWSYTDMPNSAQKVRPNNSQSDTLPKRRDSKAWLVPEAGALLIS